MRAALPLHWFGKTDDHRHIDLKLINGFGEPACHVVWRVIPPKENVDEHHLHMTVEQQLRQPPLSSADSSFHQCPRKLAGLPP